MDAKPRRRWFQFSLGGFLTLLTIGGIWFGTYVDRAHRQRDAVKALRDAGSLVYYDYPRFDPRRRRQEKSAWRDWLIERLGPDYAANVQSVNLAVDAKPPDKHSSVANDRLRIVSQFSHLESLYMNYVDVDDDGLAQVRGLRKLKLLTLSFTQVGDEGLRHLADLENLEMLDLNGTRVSDAGLLHLKRLKKLQHLNVRLTHVTEQGVKEFQKALPSCSVGF